MEQVGRDEHVGPVWGEEEHVVVASGGGVNCKYNNLSERKTTLFTIKGEHVWPE